MRRRDLIVMCLQNLFRHKGRTMLTVLGVLVGCCAVIIMVSIGIGMKESQERMLSEMGDLTIITVMPQGKRKIDDQAIRDFRSLPKVEAVSPKLTASGVPLKIFAGDHRRFVTESAELVGLDPKAAEKLGYRLEEGAFLSGKFSVLVGKDFAYALSDTKRPPGRDTVDAWPDEAGNVKPPFLDPMKAQLELQLPLDGKEGAPVTQKLTVAGRMKEDYGKGYETSMGIVMDIRELNALLQQRKRASGKAAGKTAYDTALVKVLGIQDVESVEQAVQGMGFRTSSMESIRKPMEKEARQKQMMFGGLGAISLFVAALGIANTMMMSITERTKEIGVMKSLGCFVRDVRGVFLLEAGCIGLLGGVAGVILSELISLLMNTLAAKENGMADAGMGMGMMEPSSMGATSVIPLWLVLFALAFSVLIGVASGYYPANKAVKVPALEAIKHD